MEFVKAKTILTKVKYGNEWYGIDYNMNLYRGCPHGCIYCDSRSDFYHIDNFDITKLKEKVKDISKKMSCNFNLTNNEINTLYETLYKIINNIDKYKMVSKTYHFFMI